MNNRINIRGVNFDNLTFDEAFSVLVKKLDEGGKPFSVFTPNSEIVQSCIENSALREIINSGGLIVPDGVGVITASKILKKPLKSKIPGVDLGERLIEYAAKNRKTVFLLGGKERVADMAAAALCSKYAGFNIVGTHHGYFDKSGEENDAVIADINDSRADILFVCLGSPAQEIWIYENASRLTHAKLCLALGGSLDAYAGTFKRAPSIFIKTNTEWLYRVIAQPSRIPRVAKIPGFLWETIKTVSSE